MFLLILPYDLYVVFVAAPWLVATKSSALVWVKTQIPVIIELFLENMND